jgi:hypothetical protein
VDRGRGAGRRAHSARGVADASVTCPRVQKKTGPDGR